MGKEGILSVTQDVIEDVAFVPGVGLDWQPPAHPAGGWLHVWPVYNGKVCAGEKLVRDVFGPAHASRLARAL